MTQALGFSLVLVIISNGMTLFSYGTGIDRHLLYLPWTLVLLGAALYWARGACRLSWTEIGFSRGSWRRSATIGVMVGLVLAVLLVAFLAFPLILPQPVRYREIQDLDAVGLLWRLGVELTIATALTEEVLFRGILQALFKRSMSIAPALLSTNTVFALWHLVINALTIQQNTLALPLIPPAAAQLVGYLGSLIAVGIGGLLLSLVRERTNHLAGSIGLHWVAVAAMTFLIYQY